VLQRLHAGGVPVPAREAVYIVGTEDVVVRCADGPCQAFVEAEVTTYIWCQCMETMDVHRLAGNKVHDIPVFLCLTARAPHQGPLDACAVRAGFALDLSVHHAITDGQAV
jgi:hypothetical protein